MRELRLLFVHYKVVTEYKYSKLYNDDEIQLSYILTKVLPIIHPVTSMTLHERLEHFGAQISPC